MKFVMDKSETDVWTVSAGRLKQELHTNQMVDIPPQDKWKMRYMCSLLNQMEEAKHLVQEDKLKELQDLLDSLVR